MKKRGQVWTIDYVGGFLIFIFLMILSINLLIGIKDNSNYDQTYREAVSLSSKLLTPGHPKYWNESNIIIPGLAENNRINMTKLYLFDNISYDRTKGMYNMKGEYIFFFENQTNVMNLTKCTFGYNITVDENCTPDLNSINYDNLAKIERIVIINSTLTKMKIYVWS